MAHQIYVDCKDRSPRRAVEAVRRDVGALRPGASTVVVQIRDRDVLDAVTAWADSHRLTPTVEPRQGGVWLRFFVLPNQFGRLPDCAHRELCRARGTRTPLSAIEVEVSCAH